MTNPADVTPQLPAEWHKQDCIVLAWPHPGTDWVSTLNVIEQVYIQLITQITCYENVLLFVHDKTTAKRARDLLQQADIAQQNLTFIDAQYDDTWLRDSGPISTISNNHLVLNDFRFNGWGGKFNAQRDDQLCQHLASIPRFRESLKRHELILEGGSIDTDGCGTLITTRRCLMSTTRNPTLTEQDYETFFKKRFGIERVLWLVNGELEGDDTDSHVDMLVRFCATDTIAYSACDNMNDTHYESLMALKEELGELKQPNGEPYTLVPLPIPAPVHNSTGQRLPASYANFLIINSAVLLPVYDDAMDEYCQQALAACFPERKIIPIDARPIIQQGGSIHCLSMQIPKI